MERDFDLVIIGGGPAGLAAGIYGSRATLKVAIIEKGKAGGQIVITDEIENYPGSVKDESGPSLIDRMVVQAKHFGAELITDTITNVELDGEKKVLQGIENTYTAKTVIIAGGGYPRPMGCPGEKELVGKGVSYCATCDGNFFTDLEIFVIGGGDTAVEEAMYLTKFARKVTIVHRRDELRAIKSIQDKAFKNEKIEYLWDTVVEEVKGDGIVESIVFKNVKTGEVTEYVADEDDGTFGIFVFVGYNPKTELYVDKIDMNDSRYILTDENMKTNIKGVFAAGDIREKSFRQVVTAASDGAIAANEALKYIEEHF